MLGHKPEFRKSVSGALGADKRLQRIRLGGYRFLCETGRAQGGSLKELSKDYNYQAEFLAKVYRPKAAKINHR